MPARFSCQVQLDLNLQASGSQSRVANFDFERSCLTYSTMNIKRVLFYFKDLNNEFINL